VLEQLEIFATASRPLLERLARLEAEVEFSAGTAIVHEGEAADALYVLAEGEVEVTARGELGPERHIRTLASPNYFGEIGVLQHIPRTATVTALSDCRCERIEGASLLEALATAPASSSLMENVQSRLLLTHPSLAER
jgi:ATP-binding cassette subfamily B protein